MTQYDYIIIGAGAAGLMLADAMGKDDFFSEKSILLLDKDAKKINDRTWCFWEKGEGRFDDILHRTWNHIYFGGKQFSKRFNIAPYSYKMVRGIDFYESYLKRIEGYSNISIKLETVEKTEEISDYVLVATSKSEYRAKQVFNSIFNYDTIIGQQKYPVLQQHFIGWFIKTSKPVFDADTATFMDFSIPQKGNTRFMYILPFSENEALVEYTLFSEKLLPKEEYEEAIGNYLKDILKCPDYEILEKEQGNIPMTCYNFAQHNSRHMLHIGTSGGWSKPSTGYTFSTTAKNTTALLRHLKGDKSLSQFPAKTRFWYYDLLLLDILHRDNNKGGHIFETLFKNRDPRLILKFLDEETSFWEDLKIISGCPKRDFIKAAVRRFF